LKLEIWVAEEYFFNNTSLKYKTTKMPIPPINLLY